LQNKKPFLSRNGFLIGAFRCGKNPRFYRGREKASAKTKRASFKQAQKALKGN